jgi:tetratricopeptide (TPR) repeat protein
MLLSSLALVGGCGATASPLSCDEPAEPKLWGLGGRCQDAARTKHPVAADVCLAGFMMTRDPATGARAARARQARSGELPVIEWIAGTIGDEPGGADAWLAAGFARYFHGDAGPALVALQRAASHRSSSDMLGRLHDAVGLLYYYEDRADYQAAITHAAAAFDLVDHVCPADDQAVAYLNIAGLLVDFGNVSTTKQIAAKLAPLVPVTSRYYPWLLRVNAQLEEAQDRPATAQTMLREARGFAIRDGDRALEFKLRMNLVYLAQHQGELDEAARLLAYQPLSPDASLDQRETDAYHRAALALARGDARTAAEIAERALAGEPDAWTASLSNLYGRALIAIDAPERAEHALLRSVELTERRRDALELDTLRSWLLAEQREPFEDLFSLYVSQHRLADALSIVQRATARSTLDGLLQVEPVPAGVAAVAQRDDSVRALAHALRRSRPANAPPIDKLLAQLRGNHVITYFRARRELWAVAVSADGRIIARRIGDSGTIAERALSWREHPEEIALADDLGSVLLPDEILPAVQTPIYIITDDPISDMSFAALRRNGRFVVEDHPVAYASSAAVLASMRRSPSPIRALVLGDPTYDLPQAREEAKEVAARLQVQPQLGSDATGALILRSRDATLIHIAAHTESTPIGAALRLSDGLLDASAVIDSGITAGAIVLMTCSSAAVSSRDELEPLAAAFVAAGAHTVVASRWSVLDDVGRKFAQVFYQQNGVVDPIRAVAIAQRRLLSEHVKIRDWSTFAVVGGLR